MKICEGQASAVASMVRVDGMIGDVMSACAPGTVLCLMVTISALPVRKWFIFDDLQVGTSNGKHEGDSAAVARASSESVVMIRIQ